MDLEIKKPSKIKGFFKTLFFALILTGIIIAILYFANIITFKQKENINENNNETPQSEKIDIFKTSDEEIERIFQKKYSDTYSELEEGRFLQTTISKDFVINGNSLTGYQINILKLNNHFTEDCINKIKRYFYYTDDNVNYFIIPNAKGFRTFNNSIFGVTNQSKRTLKHVLHGDDYVIFKAESVDCKNSNCTSSYGGEYIMYKKVNDNWKIELFE